MFREAELSSMEMLHNAYNMSTLTTPTRAGRGVMVPGIDTKASLDRLSTALSYGGLHTPPQSAHESRRPSLQYSHLSESAYPAGLSSFGHSQPHTPVHATQLSNEVFHSTWSPTVDNLSNVTPGLPNDYPINRLSEHALHVAVQHQSPYDLGSNVGTLPYTQSHQTKDPDVFGLHASADFATTGPWQTHHIANTYTTHAPCLGSALFAEPTLLEVDAQSSTPTYSEAELEYQRLSETFAVSGEAGLRAYGLPSVDHCQTPQVVVPSQLTPLETFSQHHLSAYTSPERSNDNYSSSFASSTTSSGSYDLLGQPSPNEDYFAHSEDEEYGLGMEDSSVSAHGPYRTTAGMPIPPKRRSSRRVRKESNRRYWHRHFVGDQGAQIEVQCQGKQFSLNQPIRVERSAKQGQHKCGHIDQDGRICDKAFDRGEHLKRHADSHKSKDERQYVCPLPKCIDKTTNQQRKIGRSDNASDHFKTHIKNKKTGARNQHVEWPYLRDLIWSTYDDTQRARKMIDKLDKWVGEGMLPSAGSRKMR